MRILYSIIQKILNAFNQLTPSKGIILTFHSVSNQYVKFNEKYTISIKSFKNLITRLTEQNFEFKSLKDLDMNSKKKYVYITFDDIDASVYTNAYPILKDLKIPFCCFVTTDFIGLEGYASLNMLLELSMDPLCTIGSHSISHPILRRIEKTNVELEYNSSWIYINKKLNVTPEFFAYPFGSIFAVSSVSKKIMKKTSYKYAFNNIGNHITRKSIRDKFFIGRYNINEENHSKIGRWR